MVLYPVRSSATLYLGSNVLAQAAEDDAAKGWGDTIVTNILKVDEDGNPIGNRRERRMASRLQRLKRRVRP